MDPQIVVESLKDLKSNGIQIAIDDFEPGKQAFIAETIVTLGQKPVKTIAEGVETEQAKYMLGVMKPRVFVC